MSENTNKGGWHENKWIRGAIPAFLGNVVEKDIHKSSLIATICFAGGMAGTGFFIWYGGLNQHSVLALVGIYVCYGFIMGIGLGTGYLSPVKTLMLWFEDISLRYWQRH